MRMPKIPPNCGPRFEEQSIARSGLETMLLNGASPSLSSREKINELKVVK